MNRKKEMVFLIHGIVGHPNEMEGLRHRIENLGYDAYSTCLPEHGDSPGNLARVRWHDFIEHCNADLQRQGAQYDRIHLIGFSLGGAISLALARRNPDKICSLTLAATPYKSVYNLEHVQYHVKHLFNRFLPGMRFLHESNTGHPKPFIMPHNVPLFYNQMDEFFREVQESIQAVSLPTLLLHSPYDITVPYEHSEWLFHNLKGEANFITLLDGGHQIFPYRISGLVEDAIIQHIMAQQEIDALPLRKIS